MAKWNEPGIAGGPDALVPSCGTITEPQEAAMPSSIAGLYVEGDEVHTIDIFFDGHIIFVATDADHYCNGH